jgi:hypothetical protein
MVELKPTVVLCHPGCEAQFGDAVTPCGALIRTVEHEAHDCECWCDTTPAWTEEVRCRRVPHATGEHDEHAEPVVWFDAADSPPLVSGRTYGVRLRCHEAGVGGATLFRSPGEIVIR